MWQFWFVLKYFMRNFFSGDYVHIYLIYFLIFWEYAPLYASCVIKQTYEICDKNISKGKYEKLRKCLFKTKKFSENILGKGFITPNKSGDFVWQKGTWVIKKGQWRSNTPYPNLFLTLLIQIKKNLFFTKITFQGSIWSSDALSFYNRPRFVRSCVVLLNKCCLLI